MFRPGTHSICRVIDGNTNPYLSDPRSVEGIIKPIEGGYARAVERVGASQVDGNSAVVLAGWIAYVETSSPAAMRLGAAMLSPFVEESAKAAKAAGELPPSPPELGGMSLSELLSDGTVGVNVDPKYPQAMAIEGWSEPVRLCSHCRWQFLLNDHPDSPFFTSDYPISAEPVGAPRLANKVVPLSPTLAVRIIPWMDSRGAREGRFLANFRYAIRALDRDGEDGDLWSEIPKAVLKSVLSVLAGAAAATMVAGVGLAALPVMAGVVAGIAVDYGYDKLDARFGISQGLGNALRRSWESVEGHWHDLEFELGRRIQGFEESLIRRATMAW
ncbi:MAG: hypothetical protein JNK49_18300 [Planctomycetes bacterium]|nr:hypothetical protein [Planctomycetota bacterium]